MARTKKFGEMTFEALREIADRIVSYFLFGATDTENQG